MISLVTRGAPRADEQSEGRMIVARLNALRDEVTGYAITATQTNVFFLANTPAASFLETRPDLAGKLGRIAAAARTNIISYSFSFQEGLERIESMERDVYDKSLRHQKQAATKEFILCSQTFLDVQDSVKRASNNTSGQIWPPSQTEYSLERECSVASPPVWLWRGRLGEWLRERKITSCKHKTGPDGQPSIELEVVAAHAAPPSIPGPQLPCKVVLKASDLTPVSMEMFDSEGIVEGLIEFQFCDIGNGRLFCKSAVSHSYHKGRLFRTGFWRLVAANQDASREIPAISTFFEPGAYIGDYRFAQPVTYRLGYRPPSDLELQGMLTNRAGVPIYEAATLKLEVPKGAGAKRVVLTGVAVLLLAGGPLLLLYSPRKKGMQCR